ncbi:MAG: phosphatidylglycerophosphatase A [Rhodospirillales bacterium]|nr:phosphatidylglycerophosphatase A [Rhodospirillales bacterium]
MSANDSSGAPKPSGGPAALGFGPRHPAWHLATWFGVGLMPKAPGTWGSLAAVPFAYGIHHVGGAAGLLVAALVLFGVGVWAAETFRRHAGTADPQAVVIDEAAGQWLALIPAGDDMLLYAAGFFLFRLFDIWKPWPVSWADRRVGGGLGIMLDDMIAGTYAAAVLWGAAAALARP